MPLVFAVVLLLLPDFASEDPWVEVRLSITRDPYTSSDDATLCRVRAVNMGGRSWSGKSLRFEARARAGSRLVRQRGSSASTGAVRIARDVGRAAGQARPARGRSARRGDASLERDPSPRRRSTRRKSKKGAW
jgi:hypothetical protein